MGCAHSQVWEAPYCAQLLYKKRRDSEGNSVYETHYIGYLTESSFNLTLTAS